MFKKKILAAILSGVVLSTAMSVSAYADTETLSLVDEVSPLYEYADELKSLLSVSSTKATCRSDAICSNEVVTIYVEQTLQKYWGLWIWNKVDGGYWTKTQNGSSIAVSNSISGLKSGTYRLKSVFTLTTSSGKTEKITVYSNEKKVS